MLSDVLQLILTFSAMCLAGCNCCSNPESPPTIATESCEFDGDGFLLRPMGTETCVAILGKERPLRLELKAGDLCSPDWGLASFLMPDFSDPDVLAVYPTPLAFALSRLPIALATHLEQTELRPHPEILSLARTWAAERTIGAHGKAAGGAPLSACITFGTQRGTRLNAAIDRATTRPASRPATSASPPDQMAFVMLHHPGYGDPEAREADMERIIAELRRREIGFMSEGGLGSGYRVSIGTSDVPQWKRLIDDLLKAGALKGYTKWGLDERGHGLVLAPGE